LEFLTPSCYNDLTLHGFIKNNSNQRKIGWRWRTQHRKLKEDTQSMSRKAGRELKSKEA